MSTIGGTNTSQTDVSNGQRTADTGPRAGRSRETDSVCCSLRSARTSLFVIASCVSEMNFNIGTTISWRIEVQYGPCQRKIEARKTTCLHLAPLFWGASAQRQIWPIRRGRIKRRRLLSGDVHGVRQAHEHGCAASACGYEDGCALPWALGRENARDDRHHECGHVHAPGRRDRARGDVTL